MKRVIIFEGLSGAGKTTLAKALANQGHFKLVPEIIPEFYEIYDMKTESDQRVFQLNDILKIQLATDTKNQDVVMDRSGISTLGFNKTYDKINHTNNSKAIEKWFNKKWMEFYKKNNVTIFYLTNDKCKNWSTDPDNPNYSKESMQLLESETLKIIKSLHSQGVNIKIIKCGNLSPKQIIADLLR